MPHPGQNCGKCFLSPDSHAVRGQGNQGTDYTSLGKPYNNAPPGTPIVTASVKGAGCYPA